MPTVSEILSLLDSKAPMSTKNGWDNVGLLVGSGGQGGKANTDCTGYNRRGLVKEAAGMGAELDCFAHPLFF